MLLSIEKKQNQVCVFLCVKQTDSKSENRVRSFPLKKKQSVVIDPLTYIIFI